ncbi:MAG: QueT transporter family protein [Proteobacteria bacterium]|nr:QueT transporter family protein [Pseudomonadota bacterium]
MRYALQMWKNTRMIVLTAVCAAIYAATLIVFKTAIPLIPGITEVRVAGIFPMIFGILFGPAGAWGLGFGNLIGDIFGGTLGPSSIAGMAGNFLLGYLPYTMWIHLVPFSEKTYCWDRRSWRSWASYIIITIVSSAACAVVISVIVDSLGIVPYAVLSKIITLNDTVGSLVGVILLIAVYDVAVKQLGLLWTDIMEVGEIKKGFLRPVAVWLITAGVIFGLFGGLIPGIPSITAGWISTAIIITGSLIL